MRIRRLWLLLVVAGLALAACGGDDGDDEADDGTTTEAEAEPADDGDDATTDDDALDGGAGDGSTTTEDTSSTTEEGSETTVETEPADDPDGATTSTPTTSAPEDPPEDLPVDECEAFAEIAAVTDELDDDDRDFEDLTWADFQEAYRTYIPHMLAAMDQAIGAVEDDAIAADIASLRSLTEQILPLVDSSSDLVEFDQAASALPGADEAEAAGDRVAAYAQERCDIEL